MFTRVLSVLAYKAYRYELDPSPEQRRLFVRYCGTARWVYNWALSRIKTVMDAGKGLSKEQRPKIPSAFDLTGELVQLKKQKQFAWIGESSKWVPACAIENCRKALDRWFAGLKAGRKVGFPTFKSKHNGLGTFTIKEAALAQYRDGAVRLSKLGWVRIKGHNRAPEGRILKAIVRERAGRWFVSIQVECQIVVPENQGPVVGIDLGVNVLATLSDGRQFENPKHLKKRQRLLKIRQRRVSRCQKGSKRRERMKRKLAVTHYRVANQRNDAIHKATTAIARQYGAVGIEDLNVKGMMSSHSLAGAIGDAAFGEFRRQLTYKTVWYGSRLEVFHRFYPSSRTCSACGQINRNLTLKDRMWTCACGVTHNRDLNAAKNLEPTGSRPGVTGRMAVEVVTAGLARV